VRRALAAAAVALGLASLQAAAAGATDSSSSCSSGTASGARVTCPADPNQAAYDELTSRLGGDVARALTAQQRLSATLDQFAGVESSLTAQVSQEESVIANLEAEIAALDQQITDTQARIDVEKGQLAALSRALYREPQSLWMMVARTGNLHDAIVATADAVVAGQRAHALQDKLEADLAALQAQLDSREADLSQETDALNLLQANLAALQDVIARQNTVSANLTTLIGQINAAKAQLRNQPPDVTSQLAQLLEAQEQDLILRSYETAWAQAQVGTGVAMVNQTLPLGRPIDGLSLAWPLASFRITQPFGPSSVALEPPYGQYPHFHTGIDLAAPLGSPVYAAADGVVVAVGHSAYGYGNYVIIAHGGGIATLYGHLLQTRAAAGEQVSRGQVIGLEGESGLATGPHVHFELRVDNQVVDPMPYLPIPGTHWSG
jgi:murein DD-endopeptidase MepM/ murein hydrolase activator NlpD